MLDRFAGGALDVLAELTGDGEGPHVPVGELLGVIPERPERLDGGQGDRQHGESEEAESSAKTGGDRQVGEARHAPVIGLTDS